MNTQEIHVPAQPTLPTTAEAQPQEQAQSEDWRILLDALTKTNMSIALVLSRLDQLAELNGLRVRKAQGTETNFVQR